MAICILGDLHFRSDRDFFIRTCEEFLKWFKDWSFNNSNNELVLAGDLVESATSPGGLTISFLEQFSQNSKFKKIHICVGNHDEKKVNGIPQLAYEFFEHKSNIYIYKTPTETIIDNKKALILPYFSGTNDDGLTLGEYYSSIYKNKAFKNDYDLIVGHFSGEDASFPGSSECVKNLDKLSGKVCLGHIHTRNINPQRYIGSIFAGKKSENDYTRAAWILENDNWFEDPLPLFNEFLTITYPEDLPKSKASIPIYTILNCGSEVIAKRKYGNIFIRRTTSDTEDLGIKKTLDLDRQFTSIRDFNIKELFKEFVKNQDPPLSSEVIRECQSLLIN